MGFKCLQSGSSGNCFTLFDEQTRILIECGIPYKKLLQGIGFNLSQYEGCILTHEHADHSHTVKDIMKAGINCYMSHGTAQALDISGYRVKTIEALKPFNIGTYKVMAFDVNHDAAQPFGYVIKSTVTKESLVFITDSYYVSNQFKNVDYFAIESNYITEHFMQSSTAPELKKRLFTSHMSLENSIKFLQAQDLSKCKKIYLTHISKTNGDGEIMRREVMKATGKETIICGKED